MNNRLPKALGMLAVLLVNFASSDGGADELTVTAAADGGTVSTKFEAKSPLRVGSEIKHSSKRYTFGSARGYSVSSDGNISIGFSYVLDERNATYGGTFLMSTVNHQLAMQSSSSHVTGSKRKLTVESFVKNSGDTLIQNYSAKGKSYQGLSKHKIFSGGELVRN